jgi:hypothetical protein
MDSLAEEGYGGAGHDQPRQRVAKMSHLTASRKLFPALNFGVLLAGMKISRPVWGLRPFRAARDITENVPNPTSVTLSPLLKASWTLSTSAFNAFSASRLVISASLEMRVTKSALFIAASLPSRKRRRIQRRAPTQNGTRQGRTHWILHDACGLLSQVLISGIPRVLRDIYAGRLQDCQPFFRAKGHVNAC